MRKSVSIVMSAYKRANLLEQTLVSIEAQNYKPLEIICVEDGDDGGATKRVCKEHGVTHMQRVHRPDIRYSNPAVPNNIGLRAATKDITILQNAECMHVGDVIASLAKQATDKVAVFASTQALDENGALLQWYTHPVHSKRPFFFCGAMLTSHWHHMRGFDQSYIRYGWDDNDLVDRMELYGIKFNWDENIIVKHQWHTPSYDPNELTNEQMYLVKKKLRIAGLLGIKANLGREWGVDE